MDDLIKNFFKGCGGVGMVIFWVWFLFVSVCFFYNINKENALEARGLEIREKGQ